jgi:glutamate carboxypeptidase
MSAGSLPMPKLPPSPLLQTLTAQLPEMVSTLRRYVEHESPSAAPEAIASLVSLIAADFAASASGHLGASGRSAITRTRQHQQPERQPLPRIRLHKFPGLGPALQIDFSAPPRAPRILLLGHTDTVFPLGTLHAMPWRERAPRLYGPGVFDMKAGIVQALFALRAMLARGPLPCRVTLLLVPDEEIGSPASHPLTRRLALVSSAVLVLEPAAAPEGACKTSRKGVARYTLRVHGHAAHAGLEFERGASAIVEAAHQVVAISALSRPGGGLTLNPGLFSGGSRSNVVAALAEVVVDLRFRTSSQAARADAALRRLRPRDPRCRLELFGGVERPPFERSSQTVRLYRLASQAAGQLGFHLAEASVGGGSDGNLTASLGVPTLDGLGAVGDHAHAPHEFVLARHMPRRAALLAQLIESLAAG